MLTDEGDRVVVAGGEVPDVECHVEQRRHGQRGLEARGRRELIGIHEIVVVVHRHEHLVLLHERHEPPRFREHRGRAEPFGAELTRRFERPIALGVREGLVEVDVVEVNPQPRVLESPPDIPVVRHRHGEPPLSRLLAQPREVRRTATLHPPAGHHTGKRLDVAGHDLALGDAECLQVLDDGRDELRVARRRQIVEAERLDAEHHAVDGRHCGRALRRRTAADRQPAL